MRMPPATRNILIINVIIYLATALTTGADGTTAFDSFALFYPASDYFRPWQFITYMFVHGGFAHLFFNMYALWLFGSMVEQTLGTKRFLILYFVAGIGAAAIHLGVEYFQYQHELQAYIEMLKSDPNLFGADPAVIESLAPKYFRCQPMVGASGAIYGLMMAFAMLHPRAEMQLIIPPVRLTAKWMVVVFGGIEILTGIFATNDGIAHFAHLGGMLFAFFLVLYWKRRLYDNYWS